MKGYVKCIIAGAVILGVGIAVLIIVLAVNGWSFNWKETAYEMQNYEATKTFDTLDFEFDAGKLDVVFYDGDNIKFDYPENNRYTFKIKESGKTLSIETKKKVWFIDWLSWSNNAPKATLYIPETDAINFNLDLKAGAVTIADGQFKKVKLKVNAGDIKAETIIATSIKCEVNAGNLEVKKLTSSDVTAEVNAGNLKLGIDGTATEYTIDIEKNLGSCNVASQKGTSNKKIKGEVNVGTLEINFLN